MYAPIFKEFPWEDEEHAFRLTSCCKHAHIFCMYPLTSQYGSFCTYLFCQHQQSLKSRVGLGIPPIPQHFLCHLFPDTQSLQYSAHGYTHLSVWTSSSQRLVWITMWLSSERRKSVGRCCWKPQTEKCHKNYKKLPIVLRNLRSRYMDGVITMASKEVCRMYHIAQWHRAMVTQARNPSDYSRSFYLSHCV